MVRDEAQSEVKCCEFDVLLYIIQPTKTGKLKVYDAIAHSTQVKLHFTIICSKLTLIYT